MINLNKIKEFCLVGDGAHASIKRLPIGKLYLSAKNFKKNGLDLKDVSYISEKDFHKYFNPNSKAITLPLVNDIILGIIGSGLGVPYLIENKINGFGVSSSVAIIRTNSNQLLPKYLFNWIRSPYFQQYLKSVQSGAAQGFLSLELIKNLPLKMHDLPTQTKIANILSAYDDLIENNNQRIQLLEEMASEIYKEWFVRLRFPGYQNTRFFDKNGNEVEHGTDGALPEGWENKKLSNIISKLESGKRPKGGAELEGVPSIGAENVLGLGKYNFKKEKYVNQIFFKKMNSGKIENKDILFYKDGADIGRVTMFQGGFPHKEMCTNEHVFLIKTKEKIYQNWLFLFFSQKHTKRLIENLNTNAAQPGINKEDIKNIKIKFPSESLAFQFDKISEPIFQKINLLALKNRYIEQTRDLLLPRLISGKLSVEELDLD